MRAILAKWQNLSRQELRWMIEAIISRRVCGRNRKWNQVDLESTIETLTVKETKRLNAWIKDRLIAHKPLQYILRSQPFCGLDLAVRPPTLIPRWETEEITWKVICILKEYVKQHSPKEIRILDLCSGSGCISLAIAHHLSNIPLKLQVIGIDNSSSAVALACINQRKLGISKETLSFIQADIFKDLPMIGSFDVIISNPPYINYNQMKELDQDVLLWEDHSALFAKDQGLSFYKRILDLVPKLLKKNKLSTLVLEIDGDSQAQFIMDLVTARNFQVCKDMSGNTRSIFIRF